MCLSFCLPISCKRYGSSFMNADKYLYKILYRLNVLEFIYLLTVTTPPPLLHDIGRSDIAAMQNAKGVCLWTLQKYILFHYLIPSLGKMGYMATWLSMEIFPRNNSL